MCDSFGGFIQIKAPELTYEAVIKAMKEGNFYFSMAPEIHEAKIKDGVLKVKTSPVEKIFVVTDSRDCYKKLAPEGETITEAEFPLNGKDGWVRSRFGTEKENMREQMPYIWNKTQELGQML